jgi:hypothetical protein
MDEDLKKQQEIHNESWQKGLAPKLREILWPDRKKQTKLLKQQEIQLGTYTQGRIPITISLGRLAV